MAETQQIRLTDAARFALGGLTVTPAARTLTYGPREAMIEPRVMQVLVTLHRRCGEVVGREELIDACWEGRTVGEDAVNRAVLKLRRALDEIGSDATVETVARVGYRLCAGPPGDLDDPARTDQPPARGSGRLWLAGGVAAAALAATTLFFVNARARPPTNRIVVVQPMRVAGTDAPARRLAQDFASDLSRAVIGHDGRLEFADTQGGTETAAGFTVAGSAASVGRNLNAVVTVTKGGDPVILWSHDYTAPLDDAVGLRQQISTNVAAVLVCALGTAGVPDKIDERTTALYFEACNLRSGDQRQEAYLLRQVTKRAPRFAGGWADLAVSLAFTREAETGDAARTMRREASAAARRALSLDPHQGNAYYARALLLPGLKNWSARARILRAGLAAQPDNPQLYNRLAIDLAAIGRQQGSIAANRSAVALDPLFPGKTMRRTTTLELSAPPWRSRNQPRSRACVISRA